MSWSNHQIRQLLALLDRPQKLQRSGLGIQLKDALGAESVHDAVLWTVNKTFEEPTRINEPLRNVILLCDIRGEKGSHVASVLNVSIRTFFRLRADAIAMLAHTVESILSHPEPRIDFKYEITRMISPVKPETAADLLEREANRMGSPAAYEAVCISARNGRDVPSSLLDKCTGYWRLLAELEIAGANLNQRRPARYQELRPAIQAALEGLSDAPRKRVEFELAYVDRLDAVRLCDVAAAAEATVRLVRAAGADLRLRALAHVCQAEQACDEGDLTRADAILAELQPMCLRLNDFRVSARTSHASSILHLLKGNYAEARDLCQVTIAALGHIEPGFAACAAALAGRAELLLARSWERPQELCARFPQSFVTTMVDSVWARHLSMTDPNLALPVAQRSAPLAASQDARGVLAYANGTLATIYELLSMSAKAQRQRVLTWEYAVPLRRPFYLYDLFVHPRLAPRTFGAFDLDEDLLAAVGRRFASLLSVAGTKAGATQWIEPVIEECLSAAHKFPGRESRMRPSRNRVGEIAPALRRAAPFERQIVTNCLRQLAIDVAYCLPPQQRNGFISRFGAAASDLCGALPA